MTTDLTASTPRFWGTPVRYTVSHAGSIKLYASTDGATRTVTTLRATTAPEQVASDFNHLVCLVDFDRTPCLLDQLAKAGADTAALSNLTDPWDPAVGITLHLSRLLEEPAAPLQPGTDPALWTAGPLLRLLAAAAGEPEASRRALIGELASILAPLDGPVVRAEYELSGWFNIAPWVDTLNPDQLRVLLLSDRYDHDELCRDLLTAWSFPGGVLEDAAGRIDNDSDFRLLVNHEDVVRRLAATRRDLLAQVYAQDHGQEYDIPEIEEAAFLAASLITE